MSVENDAWGGRARRLMDAFPAAVLLVDKDTRVLLMNRATKEYLATPEVTLETLLCGDVLQCVHPRESGQECGDTEFCADCTVRQAIRSAVAGEEVLRRWGEMRLLRDGKEQVVSLLVSVSAVEDEGPPLFLLVLEDVSEIAQLRRLLPICASCGKIRSGEQYWQSVAEYLQEHTAVEFTHGLCPECSVDLYCETGQDSGRESRSGRGRRWGPGRTTRSLTDQVSGRDEGRDREPRGRPAASPRPEHGRAVERRREEGGNLQGHMGDRTDRRLLPPGRHRRWASRGRE